MPDIRQRWILDIGPLVNSLKEADGEITNAQVSVENLGETFDEAMASAADATEEATGKTEELGGAAEEAGEEGKAAGASFKGGMIVAAAGAAAALASVAALVNETIALGDEINLVAKRARTVGASAEEFQLVQGALDLMTDGSARAEMALTNLNRKIDDARTKGGVAADQFKRMGLSADELAGAGATERLLMVADGIATLGDRAAQTAVAADLMGRAGRSMVDSFAQGRGPFEDSFRLIEQAGIVSNETAAEAEALADSVYLAQQSFLSLKVSGLQPMMPVVREGIDLVSSWMQEFAKSDEAKRAFEDLAQVMRDTIPTIEAVLKATEDLGWALRGLAELIRVVGDGVDVVIGLASAVGLVGEEAGDAAWEVGKYSKEAREAESASRAAAAATRDWADLLGHYARAAESANSEAAESAMSRADAVIAAAKRQIAAEDDALAERLVQLKVQNDGTIRAAEEEQAILDAFQDYKSARLHEAFEEARRIREEEAEAVKRADEREKQSRGGVAADETAGRAEKVEGERTAARQVTEAWEGAYMAIGQDYVTLVEDQETIREREHLEWLHDQEERAAASKAANDEIEEIEGLSAAQNMGIAETFANAHVSLQDTVTGAIVSGTEKGTAARRKAEKEAFIAHKIAALAAITVSTAQSLMASAEIGFPAAIPGVLAAAAMGTVATAMAAAEMPSFHAGMSEPPKSDEVRIIGQREELSGILTRQGQQAAGGEEGVRRLNQGGGGGPSITMIRVGNETTQAQEYESKRTRSGPWWEMIQGINPGRSYLRNPFPVGS